MEITENSKEKDLKYYTEELARLKEEEPENIEDIEKIDYTKNESKFIFVRW